MTTALNRSFVPNAMMVASADCESLYNSPLLSTTEAVESPEGRFIRVRSLPQLAENGSHAQFVEEPDVEHLIRSVDRVKYNDQDSFFNKVLEELIVHTTVGRYAQRFETWGHPVACILVISSANKNPMSALTQLYQRSYTDCPQRMSPDFLRCVLYVDIDHGGKKGDTNKDANTDANTDASNDVSNEDASNGDAANERSSEDFDTIFSQFGPYCYKIDGFEALESGLKVIAAEALYPYMQNLIRSWQLTGTAKRSNAFGFGKLLKKLVNTGPPKPETNLFSEVCREMQPHVASIPAKKGDWDIDMQVRRLADVAFMLHDYKLAHSAYESLRKPFNAEQKWAPLGGICEMAAVTAAILGHSANDITQSIDPALYTYTSRIRLTAHALRCVLLVASCSIESGNQLLAAELLSSTLIDINPVLGSGDEPAESATLMEEISKAYKKRGWHRKVKLWDSLAEKEWERVPTDTNADVSIN